MSFVIPVGDDSCPKCKAPGEVTQVGTATGTRYFRCGVCFVTWREKNKAAAALGSLGGRARADALSPAERSDSARAAVSARWGK